MRPRRPQVQPYGQPPAPARYDVPPTRPQVQARARSLGDLVERALDPVVRKRGFANANLFAKWDAIAGERLAGLAVPEEIKWRRGREGGGTLVLGCASGDALELQHMRDLLLERINTFLGWRAIEAVRLQTGRRRPTPPAGPSTVADRSRPAPATDADDRLDGALARLAGAVDRRFKGT